MLLASTNECSRQLNSNICSHEGLISATDLDNLVMSIKICPKFILQVNSNLLAKYCSSDQQTHEFFSFILLWVAFQIIESQLETTFCQIEMSWHCYFRGSNNKVCEHSSDVQRDQFQIPKLMTDADKLICIFQINRNMSINCSMSWKSSWSRGHGTFCKNTGWPWRNQEFKRRIERNNWQKCCLSDSSWTTIKYRIQFLGNHWMISRDSVKRWYTRKSIFKRVKMGGDGIDDDYSKFFANAILKSKFFRASKFLGDDTVVIWLHMDQVRWWHLYC